MENKNQESKTKLDNLKINHVTMKLKLLAKTCDHTDAKSELYHNYLLLQYSGF